MKIWRVALSLSRYFEMSDLIMVQVGDNVDDCAGFSQCKMWYYGYPYRFLVPRKVIPPTPCYACKTVGTGLNWRGFPYLGG
jgi:hypothetical protein